MNKLCQRLSILSITLLTACTVPLIDASPPAADLTQRFVEMELQRYWQARYAAYLAGHEEKDRFFARFTVDPTVALPMAVEQAYAFYDGVVQQADWGNVYLLRLAVRGRPFYLIDVTTDGDDGWIELYGLDGSLLGAARRYLELVSWGDPQSLRRQTATGEFPAALIDRRNDTLWGK